MNPSLVLSAPCRAPERRRATALELSRLHVRLALATTLLCALACLLAGHLIWNWTPSLPLGLYWLSRGAAPGPGKLVAFPVPANVQDLVLARNYLPPGAMLVKTVVATAGDRVCTAEGTFSVNGRPLAGGGHILTEDSAGRPLPHYEGCGEVPEGQVFVASPHARSFDSRTFGPVRAADIRGTVTPLWTY
jgi:conjugative transfer signal peptidase TraF